VRVRHSAGAASDEQKFLSKQKNDDTNANRVAHPPKKQTPAGMAYDHDPRRDGLQNNMTL
jgi:hypothetical protein